MFIYFRRDQRVLKDQFGSKPTNAHEVQLQSQIVEGKTKLGGVDLFRSRRQCKTRRLTVTPALDHPRLFNSRTNPKCARGTSSSTSAAPNSISIFVEGSA